MNKFYIIIIIIIIILDIRRYSISAYKKERGKDYLKARLSKEERGIYELFKQLELLSKPHMILANVVIPVNESSVNGKDNKIDAIFIHETGIYVLLYKNISGWINGKENDEYWTLGKKEEKSRFKNPVLENKENVVELKKFLDLNFKYFASFLVFGERARVKHIGVKPEKAIVLRRSALRKAMKFIIGPSAPVFTEEEIIKIYNQLKPYSIE